MVTDIKGFQKLVPIGRTKTFDLIRQGRLQTVKIGRRTLITVASIERLIEANASREA